MDTLNDVIKVDDYILTKKLAKTNSDFYLATKEGSSSQFIVKVIDKKNESKYETFYRNEIAILKDVNHPNIIKLLEVKETDEKIYLFKEYCNGGNLEVFIKRYKYIYKKTPSEEIVQYIMSQLINAMYYLYNKKIIHRNIKLGNIFINYENVEDSKKLNILNGTIKIIDFGFATYLQKGELITVKLGTPLYMSPIILNKEFIPYDEKTDIWSLGIICYELLTGKHPFNSFGIPELIEKINKGDYNIPITLSLEALSFINSMLKYDEKDRISYDELKDHEFLKKSVKEFRKINVNELKDVKMEGESEIIINNKSNQSF